jgi:general secretion pathway protein I
MGGRRDGARGFTLIEVLVAFAVLALSLGAVLPGLSGGLATARTSADAMAALAYAQSLLAATGARGRVVEGEFRDTLEGGRFRTRLVVRRYAHDTSESGPALYEVVAELRWGAEGSGARSVALATLRYATAQ